MDDNLMRLIMLTIGCLIGMCIYDGIKRILSHKEYHGEEYSTKRKEKNPSLTDKEYEVLKYFGAYAIRLGDNGETFCEILDISMDVMAIAHKRLFPSVKAGHCYYVEV